jgi:hypothetical protein
MLETVVFAEILFEKVREGQRALHSSMDSYDVEYGWDSHDFEAAVRGEMVHYYTLDFNALIDDKIVSLSNRLNRAKGARYDLVVLRRRDDSLFDIGAYGMFDTLRNEKSFSLEGNIYLLDFDGKYLYFRELFADNRIRRIDVNSGKENHVLHNSPQYTSLDREKNPLSFSVNGSEYTLGYTTSPSKCSTISDDCGKVLWQGRNTDNYAAAAIGFPEEIIRRYLASLSSGR